MKHDYTVTFATLNCIEYTQKCIESLIKSGTDISKIVVVDNASSDETCKYLKTIGLKNLILNRQNLSCGTAWNQGLLVNQSEWTIIINNDIIVTDDFANKLINFAIKNNLKIVSPARIDGDLNYNLNEFSMQSEIKTKNCIRKDSSHAICMCIHWSVFCEIGFFRADPNLLGFEDGIFYNEVRNKNIKHATTGCVWIHHFGSVTQNYLKTSLGKKDGDLLLKVNDRKIYKQSWLSRKIYRYNLKNKNKKFREEELRKYDMTLIGARINNDFIWF